MTLVTPITTACFLRKNAKTPTLNDDKASFICRGLYKLNHDLKQYVNFDNKKFDKRKTM